MSSSNDDEKPKDAGEANEERKSISDRLKALVPPWVITALNSQRAWKTLVRCWLASWATYLLIIPNTSLRALGNAAFFGVIASFLLPPNMPLQMFIFSMLTLALGMGFGWAWGAAAMRAGLTARSQVLLASQIQRAQEGAAGAANPDAVFELDVFEGMFTDWRSSVVYGVFLGTGVAFLALVRAYAPRLTLLSVFGTIVLDVYCTFGPLLPSPSYTIISTFFISTGCYAAIALACIVLIFPETLQHAYLDSMEAFVESMAEYIEFQDTVLRINDVDKKKIEQLDKQSAGKRTGLLLALQGLTSRTALIDAEFSYGRWSGHDCASLEEPLKVLTARLASIHSFMLALSHTLITQSTPSDTRSTDEGSQNTDASQEEDVELTRQLFLASSNSSSIGDPEQFSKALLQSLPILDASTRHLREACASVLTACAELIGAINHGRWASGNAHRLKVEQKEKMLAEKLEELQRKLEEYKKEGRLEIVDPYLPLLQKYMHKHEHPTSTATNPDSDPDFQQFKPKLPLSRTSLPLRPLVVTCVFASHVCTISDTTIAFVTALQNLSAKRTHRRLWAPGGLRSVANFALGRKGGKAKGIGEDTRPDEIVDDDSSLKEDSAKEKKGKDSGGDNAYRRDPDSRPPSNAFQRVMDVNHRLWKWSRTAEATFVWKYVVISLLLWFPATLSSFAHFYYVEKGVWALIMAQTTMNIYMSDQIYNYVARIFGTFVGLIIGLVGWYAGNGHGNGNPYGSAAAMAVVLVPVVFARINAPMTSIVPIMMCSATLVLIMGYSWIDGHLVTVGNPGIGWSIAWKRWVLVVIGCGASFILMMIPPTSARKAVRLKNATIISELSSLYSHLMSAWITEEEQEGSPDTRLNTTASPSSDLEKNPATKKENAAIHDPPEWAIEFRRRLISLGTQLQALRAQTATAKWEGNLRGVWPFEEYDKLLDNETEMLASLAQLSSSLQHLSREWRVHLNKGTLVLNPDFITDVVSIFALVSQSLRTGEPLHQILPSSLIDRMLYHQTHKELALSVSGHALGTSLTGTGADAGDSEAFRGAEQQRGKVDPVERIRSPEFIYYATGIAAVAHTITCLDEMHRIAKRLCGEIPFHGFEEWRSEYERVYELRR